ncbi:response receiver sensor diguanylate cyclase, GAF domain-containing [Syntrophotalea carbinolica DSM 2380]|uniref:diguanylate cyclase n=1 Tax=Syntrophotalea carbinolica (strain DSM 2380 / NBRC 103641 / GraBd1) TaxID=338963 RepID=Q3A6W4_SYNC1|nr:diguanylate cyclase [Syntrophotalea carbinolica]ABA87893.1 response receiver sensor diguanylate cyclase, GAF domain-containing [Syntrophotalea carbinolica DSM 2380]
MKKILIIDQQDFSRIELKNFLDSEYLVIESKNEKEALEQIDHHHPDLVILDMDIIGENSPNLCLKLKRSKGLKNVPLILLFSSEHKEAIVNGLHSGADDYLTKPFNRNDLLSRIEIHLRTQNYYSDLRKNDLLMLLELTETISVTRNPRRILSIIVERLIKTIDVSRCSIIGINDFGELLVLASSDLPENQEIKLDLKKYPEIEKALETQRPVVLQDITNSALMKPVKKHIEALSDNAVFVVPIIKKQNVIGTFFLRTACLQKGGITDRIFKLCQVIASISGNALENAIIFESMETNKKLLEDLSVRDSLTKLYNHQHYHSRLEDEFSRAQRYNLDLSCIFLDIDNFKNINDRYGHLAGDMVLRQIARLISQVIRKSDISARYGGEEFAICLPNTGGVAANELAERLLVMIRELSIQQLKGEHVTVSIGTSTYSNHNVASYSELLHLADDAMYEAKKSGKNRFCCSTAMF